MTNFVIEAKKPKKRRIDKLPAKEALPGPLELSAHIFFGFLFELKKVLFS